MNNIEILVFTSPRLWKGGAWLVTNTQSISIPQVITLRQRGPSPHSEVVRAGGNGQDTNCIHSVPVSPLYLLGSTIYAIEWRLLRK